MDLTLQAPLPTSASRRTLLREQPSESGAPLVDIVRERVVRNPATTFMLQAKGHAMSPSIKDGDLLVVDRSLPHFHGDAVVVRRGGSFMVRRLFRKDDFLSLQSDNPEFSAILMEPDNESENKLEIWGVVTFVLHQECSR